MKNPFKLTPFKHWTKKDFLGKGNETGWEEVLKKGHKVSILKPMSNRYWIDGDDSKYYTADELSAGGYKSNVITGEANADVANVDSTAIELIEYDPVTKILSITYKGGGKGYDFPNVPASEVEALLKAPSKGKYVAFNIVPKYSTNR